MNAFSLDRVSKHFLSREGTAVPALEGVSFAATGAGITCIAGPTGSGKSTILRILSGLERADAGLALVAGKDPAGLNGQIGYLTQRHTLFPWMRVRENIGLPLSLRNVPEGEISSRVAALCGQLGLAGSEHLYPYELSGGMQQRAALGRLLASESRFWLMDEPFTALDERSRHQLQQLLIDLRTERDLSVLFVTHSIDEAVFLADRVVVLSAAPGRVVDSVDISLGRPRDRLSPAYGALMERVRTAIEAVL